MSELSHFKDYIQASTFLLNDTLLGYMNEEGVEYDVTYERFLKMIENYKINMLNELKMSLCPKSILEEKQKERDILLQMKCVVTLKIKCSIERLNQETTQSAKQEIVSYISILNDSLHKIDSSLDALDNHRAYSPLSQSMFSQDLHFSRLDDTLNASMGRPNKTIITPMPQYKEKGNTDITSKLTPLLSEYTEATKCGTFKTPVQFVGAPKTQIKHNVSNVTPELKSSEPNTVNKLNSFHKTEDRNPSNPNNGQTNAGQTVSLFEMFDKCLNSIMPNQVNSNPPQTPQMSKNMLFGTPVIDTIGREDKHFDSIKTDDLQRSTVGLTLENLEQTAHKKTSDVDVSIKLEARLIRLFMRKTFNAWRKQLEIFQVQQFDDDFDLIHDKIAGMEGLGIPQTDEDFFVRRSEFSISLNKDDIPREYVSQHNLLSTQLSFCEENNIRDFNSARVEQFPTLESDKPSTPQKPEPKKTKKIRETSNIEESKPKANSAVKDKELNHSRRPSAVQKPNKPSLSNTETARFPMPGTGNTPNSNSASKKSLSKGILEKNNQNVPQEKIKQRSSSISKIPMRTASSKPNIGRPPSISNKENAGKMTSPGKITRNGTFATNK